MPKFSDEAQALMLLEDSSVLEERSPRENRGSTMLNMRFVLMPAVLFSIIAVLPVPYLVFKSIYLLTHHNEEDSFHEMIKTNNILFWAFGPLASLLATLAVAPFNIYNTYKTVVDFRGNQFSMRSLNLRQIPYLVVRALAFSFGVVNGYNMALAYNDVVISRSLFSTIFRAFVVGVATIFAGLDSRVVFDKFKQEAPQDGRYAKRAVRFIAAKCSLFSPVPSQEFRLVNEMQFSEKDCDDHRQILIYGKSYADLISHRFLLENNDWIADPDSESFQNYLTLIKDDFPLWRYLGGDVLGGALSLALSVFNAFNTWNYARKATLNFFEYLGLDQDGEALQVVGVATALISSVVSVLMSFYLIRDLFFRDIFKKPDCSHFGKKLAIKVGTLIPALCFALLNVALTLMNDSLDSTTKLLVSLSAILGSTTVLRYSIEGALEEWSGHSDLRNKFEKIPEKIYRHNLLSTARVSHFGSDQQNTENFGVSRFLCGH